MPTDELLPGENTEKHEPEIKEPISPEIQEQAKEARESGQSEMLDAEARMEIENIELNESDKIEAEQKAEKIKPLQGEQRLQELLQSARKKGVAFAVETAKKLNDPYLIDSLRDTLGKEGFYKKLPK